MSKSFLKPGLGIVLSLLIQSSVFGQQSVIDSLENLIAGARDTSKVNLMIRLSGYYYRIEPNRSIEISEDALQLAQQMEFKRGAAKAYNLMGVVYSSLGNFAMGLENYLQALAIFEELGEKLSVGITSNNIGTIYRGMGNYSEAIHFYQRSLAISEELNNYQGKVIALNNIGNIYFDWQKYNLAEEYFRRTLSLLEAAGDESRIAVLLNNLGNICVEEEKYDSALIFFSRSLDLNQEIGDRKGILNSLKNMGDLYRNLDDPAKARKKYEEALEIATGLGDRRNISYLSIRLGELHAGENMTGPALASFHKGLSTAIDIESANLKKEAYLEISDFYGRTGRYDSALWYYKQYTVVKDTLFNQDSRKELSEMQTIYETEKKEREIQIQKLKIQQQQNAIYYIAFSILFLVILAYLIFNRYKLKQKHYRAELERRNIEIEQRLLRTQMNPHFIFNSLNSINSFITENNTGSAQLYLSKFARLMRYILDNSRKSFVPVEDEKNTLQLNLELEQLRFGHKFDFEINIDEQIDEEYTFIPPMLVQPFVENSIIHGMTNKTGNGKITIGMRKINRIMECIIEDDGIGREKAAEISRLKKKPGHKSLGMQVTQERLELLNEKNEEDIYVRIIDLKDEAGMAAGTRVEMYVPCEEE